MLLNKENFKNVQVSKLIFLRNIQSL